MIRYLVATHSHLEGVRLSKAGNWCNEPFATDAEAIAFAEADAKGRPCQIRFSTVQLSRRK